ncbi:hypothetical protein EYF80_029089 [Liparis tanakae]|uniref:Uncharacterized protein n=1 Tax=Liparis tanakae TaxID=230148 RepID=A0A4Z2H669_9TELE|nr:hypothetical protein EYF80_029089 [Liparis tanakae]
MWQCSRSPSALHAVAVWSQLSPERRKPMSHRFGGVAELGAAFAERGPERRGDVVTADLMTGLEAGPQVPIRWTPFSPNRISPWRQKGGTGAGAATLVSQTRKTNHSTSNAVKSQSETLTRSDTVMLTI